MPNNEPADKYELTADEIKRLAEHKEFKLDKDREKAM
jgi:hypothetical protein